MLPCRATARGCSLAPRTQAVPPRPSRVARDARFELAGRLASEPRWRPRPVAGSLVERHIEQLPPMQPDVTLTSVRGRGVDSAACLSSGGKKLGGRVIHASQTDRAWLADVTYNAVSASG